MNGLHLIADLADCRCPEERLTDATALEAHCVNACKSHGLTVVGRLFHSFGMAAGVTGAVVLAESHLTIHTWPEVSGVTLDLYVCNFSGDNSERARALFDELTTWFAPERREEHTIRRSRPGLPPQS